MILNHDSSANAFYPGAVSAVGFPACMARVKISSSHQGFEWRWGLENDLKNVTVHVFRKIAI